MSFTVVGAGGPVIVFVTTTSTSTTTTTTTPGSTTTTTSPASTTTTTTAPVTSTTVYHVAGGGGGSGTLPYTGADIAAGLLLAGLLISVGTVITRQARRRPAPLLTPIRRLRRGRGPDDSN